MLIAKAVLDGGGTLLVLGLSRMNRERMDHGEPVCISRDTHGVVVPVGMKIMIFTGDTEESMRQTLDALINPETVVNQKREH